MKRLFSWLADVWLTATVLSLPFTPDGLGGRLGVSVARIDTLGLLLVVGLAAKFLLRLDDGMWAWLARAGVPGAGLVTRVGAAMHRWMAPRRLGWCVSAFTLVLGLLAAEIFLRVGFKLVDPDLANYLTNPYRDTGTGIYRFDPERKMVRMRPNYDRTMNFNGYQWQHHADARGYRNPPGTDQADIVLLGDSFVYGHGLPETSTLRHYLAQDTGRPVANLGEQGADLHFEYQILTHDVLQYHPQRVYLFFFFNDISDIVAHLTAEDRERFLNSSVTDHTVHYAVAEPPPRILLHPLESWLVESYLVRAWDFGWRYFSKPAAQRKPGIKEGADMAAPASRAAARTGAEQAKAGPPGERDLPENWMKLLPFKNNADMAQAMQFHLYALRKTQDFAQQNHLELVIVYLWLDRNLDRVYAPILEDACRRIGLPFYNMKVDYMAGATVNASLFLPGDNHLSDAGTKLTAKVLAEKFPLDRPPAPLPPVTAP